MNNIEFSNQELNTLLNIVTSHINQYGGQEQIDMAKLFLGSDEELQVVNKMRQKYGDDYINQINLIKDKYNNFDGGKFKFGKSKSKGLSLFGSTHTAAKKQGSKLWSHPEVKQARQQARSSVGNVASSLIQAATQAATDTGTAVISKGQQKVHEKVGLSSSSHAVDSKLEKRVTNLESRVSTLENQMIDIITSDQKGGNDLDTEHIMAQNKSLFENVLTGGKKKNDSKIIIENMLYTIDSDSNNSH